MKSIFAISTLAVALAGCSGTSTTPTFASGAPGTITVPSNGTVEKLANDTFLVNVGSSTITLPETDFSFNGQPSWFVGATQGGTYQSANALAVGGVQDGVAFSGLSGTLVAPPSGDAMFEGYAVIAPVAGVLKDLPLTLMYDLSEGTVTGSNTGFDVAGVVTGNNIGGTVNFDGVNAPLEGGFFGTQELAGVFEGASFGGILYGVRPD